MAVYSREKLWLIFGANTWINHISLWNWNTVSVEWVNGMVCWCPGRLLTEGAMCVWAVFFSLLSFSFDVGNYSGFAPLKSGWQCPKQAQTNETNGSKWNENPLHSGQVHVDTGILGWHLGEQWCCMRKHVGETGNEVSIDVNAYWMLCDDRDVVTHVNDHFGFSSSAFSFWESQIQYKPLVFDFSENWVHHQRLLWNRVSQRLPWLWTDREILFLWVFSFASIKRTNADKLRFDQFSKSSTIRITNEPISQNK